MSAGDLCTALLEFVQGLGTEELSANHEAVMGVRGELSEALRATQSPHGHAAVSDAGRVVDLIGSGQAKLRRAAEILTGYAHGL